MTPDEVNGTVRDHLSAIVSDRPVVMVASHLIAGGSILRQLHELGAGPLLVVGAPAFAALAQQWANGFVPVEAAAADSVVGQRRWEALLDDPPDEVRRRVERHDPDHRALVLLSPWWERTAFLDRPVFGGHQPAWVAYDDKLKADELWRHAGIAHTPSRVGPLELETLLALAEELDQGAGTVWTGDTLTGTHGGGSAVRWVRTRAEARATVAAFDKRHAKVRMMPFLEGQPCGIHGLVLPDGVVALRPVEHVVLRDPQGGGRFRPVGSGTAWDPPAHHRRTMQDVIRRVGESLRSLVGFRGSFCVDGVLTCDGFRPTECNPRWGAALGYLHTAWSEFPLLLAHHAVSAGRSLGIGQEDLENALVVAGDRHRHARGWVQLSVPCTESLSIALRSSDDERAGWRRAAPGETAEATLSIDPGPGGGTMSFHLETASLSPGRAIGPLVASAFFWAQEVVETGLDRLVAPPEIHFDSDSAGCGI